MDIENNQVETLEPVATEVPEAAPATSEPTKVKAEPESLRDTIKEASKSIRARDNLGKFIGSDKPPEADTKPKADASQNKEQVVKAPQEAATSVPAVEKKTKTPPPYWSPEAKAKWNELPEFFQNEVIRREEDLHKLATKHDEERVYGRQLKEVITPYMPMIQAEGGNQITAVRDLLNTAYLLRTGSPQQKGQIIAQVARQFGADLTALNAPQGNVDPQVQLLQNELEKVKGYINQSETTWQQQEQANIDSLISAFSSDPKNVHFESVKADMAALLTGKRAKDLREAYDMAVWARPDIRSKLLEDQKAELEAKRVADMKAKAEAAKNAGGSVNGGPGVAVPNTTAPNRSLREELKANLRAATH